MVDNTVDFHTFTKNTRSMWIFLNLSRLNKQVLNEFLFTKIIHLFHIPFLCFCCA